MKHIEQTNKQTNKPTNQQTNKQTNKQNHQTLNLKTKNFKAAFGTTTYCHDSVLFAPLEPQGCT